MTPPDPRKVERMLADDPRVIRALADIAESKMRPAPAPPTPTPKPPPRKATPMRRRTKTKTTPEPKRNRVTMRLADVPDQPMPFSERLRLEQAEEATRPTTSAHDTTEATPCRICGAEVPMSGDRWGVWRQHRECAHIVASPPLRVIAAAGALGVAEVDAATAALTEYRVPLYIESHREPTYSPKERKREPWGQVDRRALVAAVSDAMTEVAESEIPRPGEAGKCAWCGRTEAVEWRESGHVWRDGSEASLCGGCAVVFERRGQPNPAYPDDARSAVAEAVSGVPVQLGEEPPSGLLTFIECEGEGDGTPWSHLDPKALSAYRWARWTAWPKHAPEEHRAEAEARRAAREAERAGREAAREDSFGFSSIRIEPEDAS